MENVKYQYHRIDKIRNYVEYCFRVPKALVEKVKTCALTDVSGFFPGDDLYKYRIVYPDGFEEEYHKMFVETIERVCNLKDESYIIDHIVTNDRRWNGPSEIHEIMNVEYGLADIRHSDDKEAKRLEWDVAHFFIHLQAITFTYPDD